MSSQHSNDTHYPLPAIVTLARVMKKLLDHTEVSILFIQLEICSLYSVKILLKVYHPFKDKTLTRHKTHIHMQTDISLRELGYASSSLVSDKQPPSVLRI